LAACSGRPSFRTSTRGATRSSPPTIRSPSCCTPTRRSPCCPRSPQPRPDPRRPCRSGRAHGSQVKAAHGRSPWPHHRRRPHGPSWRAVASSRRGSGRRAACPSPIRSRRTTTPSRAWTSTRPTRCSRPPPRHPPLTRRLGCASLTRTLAATVTVTVTVTVTLTLTVTLTRARTRLLQPDAPLVLPLQSKPRLRKGGGSAR